MPLLDPDFLTRLSRMVVATRRRASGVQVGERRSQRRGNSQEFADHRPYVPGDDLRFLDWHLYGRLDTLWVKLFEEEQDRLVQVLLDCSASMLGEKLEQARKVAAALSYVALSRTDRLGVAALSTTVVRQTPPIRGRSGVHGAFSVLEAVTSGGETDLVRAIEQMPRHRGSGIALLFTDFFHPDGPEGALRKLLARGFEVHAFHVVAPAEIRPPIDGDLRIVDGETGEEVDLTVDDGVLDRYEARMRGFLDGCEQTCRRLGVGYFRLSTQVPVEDLVLGDLRRLGLLA